MSFELTTGLLKPRKVTRKLKSFLDEVLDLGDEHELLQAQSSKHRRAAATSVQDVVLYKKSDGTISCAQIAAHFSVDGAPFSLLQEFSFFRERRSHGFAEWNVTEGFDIISTDEIIDPMVWCECSPGTVRALVPVHIDLA